MKHFFGWLWILIAYFIGASLVGVYIANWIFYPFIIIDTLLYIILFSKYPSIKNLEYRLYSGSSFYIAYQIYKGNIKE